MEELDNINEPREKLWAQAMLFACDVTNKSVTTSRVEIKSSYELWFGKAPTSDLVRPFVAAGYARRSVREHKMAPRGVNARSWESPHLPQWHGQCAISEDKSNCREAGRVVDRQA